MKYVIAIVIFLILVFFGIVAGFFVYTFVKRRPDKSGVYDMHLDRYKDRIKAGMDFLETTPHTTLAINSFDGLHLSAEFYAKDNARGIIMLVHGYRSSAKRDFSCAAQMYMQMGFSVLLLYQRCADKSEGKLITFGIKERRDVVSWANFLCEKFGSNTPIFMSGLSMGATSVMMASELELPKNIKGIVADSGFSSPIDIIKDVAVKKYHIKADAIIPFMNMFCKVFGRFSLYEASAVEAVKNTDIPILFIHGEADGFVPCEMTLRAYKAANTEKYLLTVPNADHGLSYLVDEKATTDTLKAFFDKYI